LENATRLCEAKFGTLYLHDGESFRFAADVGAPSEYTEFQSRFPDTNVLATGDTFANGRYPNSDFFNGGNIKGMIAAVDGYLAVINDQTKIVPWHGPLANKTDLVAFREMLVTSRDRMANLIAEGKAASEADAQVAKPFADLDAKWAANEQASRNWVRVVYNSMKP
jgi:glyoxylase-like metal-dependent hydrolase (beta-lactamase superfamily II)